jgi:6-phosphogluconolactonase
MAFELLSFPSADDLAKSVATQWLEQLAERKGKPPRQYNVALSGGRIAKTFFSEIERQAAHMPEDLFEGVHFFWADERCVPPGDPESNYSIAHQLLFEPLGIPTAQIHRLRGEGPEPLALQEAVDDILNAAPVVRGQPVLEMVFLGMGEDGHVASLFPGEQEKVVNDEAVYRAVTAVKPPPRRMTLGYAAIEAATEVWVMVSGAGKEKALRESLSPTGKTPLARVLQKRPETKVFTDVKAD